MTVSDRVFLCLLSVGSVRLVSANCVFNFNVYLLGIVPTPIKVLSLSLASGPGDQGVANEPSPLRLAESFMFLSTVWPLLSYAMVLSLVAAALLSASCHFALHISSRALLTGLEALVDFCLPIPTSWSYCPDPAYRDFRLLVWNLISTSWVQECHHVLLSLQLAVLVKYSPGKEPGWSWSLPSAFPFPEKSAFSCFFPLTEDSCPI